MLKRVLVLDDNQDILEIVHEALSYEQFEVKSVTEGKLVMPAISEFNPDLVILDYRVAGDNGGEICRRIKAQPELSDLPVIIYSAYINHHDEMFAYGCDAIISKPFDLEELIEKVNQLIHQRRLIA